jgi:signal transduction histidine kinase
MFIIACGIVLFVVFFRKKMIEKGKLIKQLEVEKNLNTFRAAAEAEERERERIALNLHDEISIQLTIHKHALESHAMDFERNDFSLTRFYSDIDKIETLRQAIHACATELVPAQLLKKGLLIALEDHIVQLNSAGKVEARFVHRGCEQVISRLSRQDLTNIYRICLELMNNAIKHSAPKNVALAVSCNPTNLIVTLDHNGQRTGSSRISRARQNGEGLGLKSIEARRLMLGAILRYSNRAEAPAITLTVPVSLKPETHG